MIKRHSDGQELGEFVSTASNTYVSPGNVAEFDFHHQTSRTCPCLYYPSFPRKTSFSRRNPFLRRVVGLVSSLCRFTLFGRHFGPSCDTDWATLTTYVGNVITVNTSELSSTDVDVVFNDEDNMLSEGARTVSHQHASLHTMTLDQQTPTYSNHLGRTRTSRSSFQKKIMEKQHR